MIKNSLNDVVDIKTQKEILKMNPKEVYEKYTDELDGFQVLFWIHQLCKAPTGYIYKKRILEQQINPEWIAHYLNNKELIEIHDGMYYIDGLSPNNICYVQELVPNGVLFFQTALILHGLCEYFHDVVFITVPDGTIIDERIQKAKNVFVIKSPQELMDIGKQTKELGDGTQVFVYDKERTICDIIRYKNELDDEVFDKALKWYFWKNKNNQESLKRLFEYGKFLDIEKNLLMYKEEYEKI